MPKALEKNARKNITQTEFFPQSERIYGRQIAFVAAFLLPLSKFLEVP